MLQRHNLLLCTDKLNPGLRLCDCDSCALCNLTSVVHVMSDHVAVHKLLLCRAHIGRHVLSHQGLDLFGSSSRVLPAVRRLTCTKTP